MQTKYNNLTTAELIRMHRFDIQGDELVEELWRRLEMYEAERAQQRVNTKYVGESA